MLSTLQRKENRLIKQTVFFAIYESPFHAFMHMNGFYTKRDQHDFTHIDLFRLPYLIHAVQQRPSSKVLIFRVCHRCVSTRFLVLLKGVYRVFFA